MFNKVSKFADNLIKGKLKDDKGPYGTKTLFFLNCDTIYGGAD